MKRKLVVCLGLVLLAGTLMGASCGKNSGQARDDYEGIGHALDSVEPGDGKAKPASDLPGIDVSKLDERGKKRLNDLVDKLPSPCGKSHSLRKSIEADASCKRSAFAARYVANLVSEDEDDLTIRALYDARYRGADPRQLDVEGAAHKGTPGAPIVFVEFFDYGCPHCAAFRPVLDEVVDAYPNDVVVYFKHFPLSSHPNSEPAARAAIAAQRQGKFSEMHAILLQNQEDQSIKDILLYAERLGLDMTRFNADFASKETAAVVERDKQHGIAAGVEATPTLYMNGREYSDPLGFAFLKDWIDEHLAVNR